MDIRDLYFLQLAAWLLHPGYLREGAEAPSLDQIADLVDQLIKVRNERWPQLQPLA
jgi:hypothetical protein